MSFMSPEASRDAATDAARSAIAVLLLTSVHHAYGGYVYRTPWRYHALPVSAVTALVILGALALLRARGGGTARAAAWWVFVLTTLAVPVLTIGAFEGFYNHVVKNVLYFGGAPAALLARLFPPPTYELPNDAFFELTGILQAVPAALAALHLYRMARARRTARLAAGGRPAHGREEARVIDQ